MSLKYVDTISAMTIFINALVSTKTIEIVCRQHVDMFERGFVSVCLIRSVNGIYIVQLEGNRFFCLGRGKVNP